ncbi:MAG: hypothetical protein GY851_34485 [bacterium]|nr:hypothetical protein [bacterium]
MGQSTAFRRVTNEQKPFRRITVTAAGALTIPALHPVLELTAGSTYTITDLNVSGGVKDGMTVEIHIATGSSAITFDENGNIKTTSTSLVLSANDNAKFRYNSVDGKWFQISTTNH